MLLFDVGGVFMTSWSPVVPRGTLWGHLEPARIMLNGLKLASNMLGSFVTIRMWHNATEVIQRLVKGRFEPNGNLI